MLYGKIMHYSFRNKKKKSYKLVRERGPDYIRKAKQASKASKHSKQSKQASKASKQSKPAMLESVALSRAS